MLTVRLRVLFRVHLECPDPDELVVQRQPHAAVAGSERVDLKHVLTGLVKIKIKSNLWYRLRNYVLLKEMFDTIEIFKQLLYLL